jgi:hypothetical protein
MKTFREFQEETNKKVPPVIGLGGGGGGTDSITATATGKSLKKRIKDVGKLATVPFRAVLGIKSKPDPTEKFATEGVMAIPAAAGIASKVLPAAAATIGAVGTMMQAKRKYRTRLNPGKRNSGRVLSPAEKKIFDKSQRDTDQKVTDQKPRDKVVKKILDRNAKKNKERMKIPNRIQSDRRRLLRGIAKGEVMLDQYYPTEEVDFVQYIKDRFKEKGLSGFVRPKKVEKKKKTIGDLLKNLNTNTNEEMMVAPTNNVGGGKIAGTVEAGDNPPVKKKKKTYAYGGRGSRKMWMNNK